MIKKKEENDLERRYHLLMTEEGKNLNDALERYYKTLSKCYPILNTEFKINDTLEMIHTMLLLIARDYNLGEGEEENKEEK